MTVCTQRSYKTGRKQEACSGISRQNNSGAWKNVRIQNNPTLNATCTAPGGVPGKRRDELIKTPTVCENIFRELMNIPTKKLKNGFEIPVLALGTWQMGGRFEREKNYDDSKDIEAIQKAYSLGMSRFDTAELYAEGYSEEILGKALKDKERESIFITTKVKGDNLKHDEVLHAAEVSLKRLDMDYIDLYLVHWPDPETPMKETFTALDELVEQGLIRNIGVSNFSAERLEKARKLTKNPIVLNQVHYNLIYREAALEGLLEYCQNNDVLLEAWRPTEKGTLAKPGFKLIDELCKKYDKTPAQIAINWLTSQKNVVTLFKTSDLSHLEENLGAVGWKLETKDMERLTKDYPHQEEFSNVVHLN